MIGIFPFSVLLALLAGIALLYSGLVAFKRLKGRRPLGWKQILLVLGPLLIVDGLVCLYILFSATLSHSSRLIQLAPLKCAIATAAIVVLPTLALIFCRPRAE